mmetsp:Transcript_92090/g.182892  ORF Transcript_92090/g.182892 Transcript_92090/m.182892 type:complete len:131 (-) Transcript_92090:343-735(-)
MPLTWADFVQRHPQLEHASSIQADFMRCVRPDWTLDDVCCWWLVYTDPELDFEDAERQTEVLHAEAFACTAIPGSSTWIGESCAFCLEDMQHGDEICALPRCQHVFHRACLQPWLAKKADCPLCRTGCDS